MSVIELHKSRRGRSRTVALDNGVIKSVGELEGVTVSVVQVLCTIRPTAMVFVSSELDGGWRRSRGNPKMRHTSISHGPNTKTFLPTISAFSAQGDGNGLTRSAAAVIA
jgi:hypothetical protein